MHTMLGREGGDCRHDLNQPREPQDQHSLPMVDGQLNITSKVQKKEHGVNSAFGDIRRTGVKEVAMETGRQPESHGKPGIYLQYSSSKLI